MLSLKIEIVWSVLLLYNSHLKILPVSLSCSILNISGIYSVYGDCGHTLNSLAPVRFANTLCSLFHVWLLKITLLRKFWSGKTIMKSQRVAFTYAIASKICTILSDALLLHRRKKWTSTPCPNTVCMLYIHTQTSAFAYPKAICVIYEHGKSDFMYFPFCVWESEIILKLSLDGIVCKIFVTYIKWRHTYINIYCFQVEKPFISEYYHMIVIRDIPGGDALFLIIISL